MEKRLIREIEVLKLTGLSSSTLLRLERAGKFPARLRITTRTVAWAEKEVQKWIEDQLNKSTGGMNG